jgi:uncharacterized cofD-like protein
VNLFRLPRTYFHFLYPGVRLKRWFFLLLFSGFVFSFGLGGMMGKALKGYRFHIEPLRKVEKQVRNYFIGLRSMDQWLVVLGGIGVLFAIRRGYYAILTVFVPGREGKFGQMAYERARRRRGPKVVLIGGGTGLPNLLVGMRDYSDNLSAIVTVADDGGSSGRLRKQFRMLPPGDIRNCLVALADTEPLIGKLFQHRFSVRDGDLKGHAFGNLFLTAMAEVTGDFSRAIAESSKVLAVRGRVIPVTLDLVNLGARLKNGKSVRGESKLALAGSPIERLHLIPAKVKPNPEALQALAQADLIVFTPGSLYTSVVPNLLVPGIRQAVNQARGLKIYACNVMTEPGETDGFSAADHLEIVHSYLGGAVDAVVVNNEKAPASILERYRRDGAFPVAADVDRLRQMGVRVRATRLINLREGYIRHDSVRLARAVMRLAII